MKSQRLDEDDRSTEACTRDNERPLYRPIATTKSIVLYITNISSYQSAPATGEWDHIHRLRLGQKSPFWNITKNSIKDKIEQC